MGLLRNRESVGWSRHLLPVRRRTKWRFAFACASLALVAGAIGSARALEPAGLGSDAAGGGLEENEAREHTFGGAALRFRHLQKVDENGEIPPNALMDAAAHVDRMKAASPSSDPAQDVAGITPASWNWLGPGNIGGRIRSILIHPTTPDTMWVGSVTGGIFKTTNGGATWTHLDDFMSNLAVTSLVAHPSTPNTIYAATGENTAGDRGNQPDEGNRGAGVFKSTNGGTSWSQLPSTAGPDWFYTNRLAMHPTNANTLLAVTNTGIFRTVDAGTTWTQELLFGRVIQDIDFDPANGDNAIAGEWGGAALYSTDGGDSWDFATGIAAGVVGSGRVEVAYAAGNPSITYASVDYDGGAIYRSTDGGQSYAFAGPTPTDVDYLCSGGNCQGSYDNAIWVSPSNPDRVIVGGIDLYQSTNQGANLTKISSWQVNQQHVRTGSGPDSAHADHHAIVHNPNYPTNLTVFFGNDGGIFKTSDVTTVTENSGWQELNNNLGITQFYGAAGSAASGKILGGTQDNGTLRYNGATETWNMTFGGDGGFNGVDPTNSNYLYGEYVYGHAFRSEDGGVNGDWISGGFPCTKAVPYRIPDACNQVANFIAPLELDPSNPQRLLVGGRSLWRTNDARTVNTATTGPSWSSIKASVGSPISAIEIDDDNSDLVYIGHNNGLIYKSTNATAASPTWTRVDLASMPSRIVLGLTIDPSNPNVVYAMFGGFEGDNVWRLSDGNLNWTEITGSGATGLPNVPTRTLAVNPNNSSWIYVGTEIGVFASENAGLTWGVPQDGPANVPVDELFMMGGDLVAATHGRGVFRASLAPPVDAPADFDGDGDTDFSVWRPQNGTWYAFGGLTERWGVPEDVPVPGQYDADAATDVAAWRPSNGTWYVQGGATQQWGRFSDVPVPGDYDGDGDTEFAVWRHGTWYVRGGVTQQWGVSPTDVPVPGDYDGDGDDDIAVFRPSNGTWYVHGGMTQQWGVSGDVPAPGQYDADPATDIAVWRPSNGTWYVHGGGTQQWGISTDIPVAGDYDGDGDTEFAVWRPDGGTWYVHGGVTQQWGLSGDKPLPPLPSVLRAFSPPPPPPPPPSPS